MSQYDGTVSRWPASRSACGGEEACPGRGPRPGRPGVLPPQRCVHVASRSAPRPQRDTERVHGVCVCVILSLKTLKEVQAEG